MKKAISFNDGKFLCALTENNVLEKFIEINGMNITDIDSFENVKSEDIMVKRLIPKENEDNE